jgi:hypothetical protein
MNAFDIIPDIHGQNEKLVALLRRLGWHEAQGTWRCAQSDRQIIFLGDFIDRGAGNAEVLRIVRGLVDSGRAQAVMGNHELNAIHFHGLDPDTGEPVRQHSDNNKRQHATFLRQFPLGSPQARDAISWFMTLPLWLDLGSIRAVHACWSAAAVQSLQGIAPDGVLPADPLLASGRKSDPLYEYVDVLTKGPEIRLPVGYVVKDKEGHDRTKVRLAWWRRNEMTWRGSIVSVPDTRELPDGRLTDDAVVMQYPEDAKPVFFGHYWMVGDPVVETRNALCLDYSAGTDGPLIAYRFSPDDTEVSLSNVVRHDGKEIPY